MQFKGVRIGFAITGSFCNFENIPDIIKSLIEEGADLIPIFSYATDEMNTRYGNAEDFKNKIIEITGKQPVVDINGAEPIGPKAILDVLIVAPCTGNTIAKLANAITDTPVTMACKAHLRNNRPVILSISTNDGLGANAKNIGLLLNMKNIFMVPFGQDNPTLKPNSLLSKNELILKTIIEALKGKQIQPLLI
jgi:dipicolinate synthase subunit B